MYIKLIRELALSSDGYLGENEDILQYIIFSTNSQCLSQCLEQNRNLINIAMNE
jgi:hypothetical protein